MRLITALVLIPLLHAADSVTSTIEQAQGYALKKNRAEATAVLRRAMDLSTSRANRARLREALGQVSRVFFTDKGQRAFETGQTVAFENPDFAIVRLRESLAVESDNVVVRLTLAKVYLFKQDCPSARAEIAAARALNPEDGDGAVLEVRAMACDANFDGLREKMRALPPLSKWQETFANYAQARAWLHQGMNDRAAEGLARVIAEAPRFPEARFYLARAEAARGGPAVAPREDALRKYVGLCKALTGRDRREFALEPRVCANQKEAEDELAKKSMDL